MEGNQLFPVFLKLNQLHTLVIGGGPVGLEKLTALLGNSNAAKVTVVAEEIMDEVYAIALQYPSIQIRKKSFELTDLEGINLIVAATNNPELNELIKAEGNRRNVLVNIADKPALCDFYLSSIVRKGDLKVAISTNGKSPTIAKRLKEVFSECLPEEMDAVLEQMQTIRDSLKGDFAAKVKQLDELTSLLVKPLK
ncbi:siroheme synthase (precorrin-2 oxidase) [Pedobacter sp. BAL39]|uniref:precorrin-2 dehydrogenase/sirohydrochlorin ferrochelatase family protein n=1 Tax=Pedobacter sp. BAL39 TaxID=391596 RepID=UPI00015595A2|nr:bifunctional precorrin-2 dehydrogenase/sirohydrochlorin ferrochelatase [Pedobacter sp. BAL39]EDM38552.1 siroheme synthase (precorrin-2 oxidase) [Pedobacter sp. BAL39]